MQQSIKLISQPRIKIMTLALCFRAIDDTNSSLESWFAAFAPVGTPPAVIARLNAECEKALADKAVRDALFKAATEPVGGDTERLARLARADSEKYARIVKEVNIKLN